MRSHDPRRMEQGWRAARQVLCSRGVAGCRFAAYRPYVLKTYAATRRWSGDALVDACERLLLEYAGKGLDPQVLIAIRSEVFTIDGPRG